MGLKKLPKWMKNEHLENIRGGGQYLQVARKFYVWKLNLQKWNGREN